MYFKKHAVVIRVFQHYKLSVFVEESKNAGVTECGGTKKMTESKIVCLGWFLKTQNTFTGCLSVVFFLL